MRDTSARRRAGGNVGRAFALLLFAWASAASGQTAPAGFEEKRLAVVPDGMRCSSFAVSPDGKQVIYEGRVGGADAHTIVQGDRKEECSYVNFFAFTPDGRPVWSAMKERKLVLVVGDRREEGWSLIESLAFSPDGRRSAFFGMKDDKTFLVVDGKPVGEFYGSGLIRFSPDGSTLAYTAGRVSDDGREAESVLVAGDKTLVALKGSDSDHVTSFAFGSDGKIVYFKYHHAKDVVVFGDGKEMELRDMGPVPVTSFAFSPDGRRFAAVGMRYIPNEPGKVPEMLSREWLAVDNEKQAEFDRVKNPLFSPDGRRTACTAMEGDEKFLVVDGKRGSAIGDIQDPVFSPDGSAVAYRVWEGGKQRIVVGDRKGEAFDLVGPPVFTPDGSRIGFGALKGNELWWKVMPAR